MICAKCSHQCCIYKPYIFFLLDEIHEIIILNCSLLKLLRKYDWEMWTTRLALFFFLSVKICTCRLQNIQLCQIYEKVRLMFLTLEKIFLFAGWFENFSSVEMYVQDRLFSLLWIALLLTSTGILLVTSQEGMFMN